MIKFIKKAWAKIRAFFTPPVIIAAAVVVASCIVYAGQPEKVYVVSDEQIIQYKEHQIGDALEWIERLESDIWYMENGIT